MQPPDVVDPSLAVQAPGHPRVGPVRDLPTPALGQIWSTLYPCLLYGPPPIVDGLARRKSGPACMPSTYSRISQQAVCGCTADNLTPLDWKRAVAVLLTSYDNIARDGISRTREWPRPPRRRD
jgi:hypothetical protein